MGASEVPSTRCALLEGSLWCEGHCWAEGDGGGFELPAALSFSCFFCLRPGMGKENWPRERPMVRRSKHWPRSVVWVAWSLLGRGRDSAKTEVRSTESRMLVTLQAGNERRAQCHCNCWGLRVYTQALRGAALGLNGGCRARLVQGWQRSTLKAHVRGQWWNLETRCNEQVESSTLERGLGTAHQDCFRRLLPTELQRRTSRGLAQGELAASNQREDAAGRVGWSRRRFVQQVSKCAGVPNFTGSAAGRPYHRHY